MECDGRLPLDVEGIRRALRTRYVAPEPTLLVYVPALASTNSQARALARDGAAQGTVIVADDQTAGRGRLGRTWSVPPCTGLTFSVIVRSAGSGHDGGRPPFSAGLVMAAGLAVHATARGDLGLRPHLKWPNDVLLDGRKVAGILVETVGPAATEHPAPPGEASRPRLSPSAERGGGTQALVLGIGLNVNAIPPGLGDRATCLAAAYGAPLQREEVLVALLHHLDRLYGELEAAPAAIWQRWRATLGTLGQRVAVHVPGGRTVHGRAEDVTISGALLVRDASNHLHTVHAGDVTLGGSPPPRARS